MHHRLPKGAGFRRLRESVLRRDRRTCQMCGLQEGNEGSHNARLTVALRVPRESGGTYSLNNLWTLCSECASGLDKIPFKRLQDDELFFALIDSLRMRSAVKHESVHVRIGELLKAIGTGKAVPSRIIDLVANQQGWRQRLRELRYLGWRITALRTKTPDGRFQSAYRLDKFTQWPSNPSRRIHQVRTASHRLQ